VKTIINTILSFLPAPPPTLPNALRGQQMAHSVQELAELTASGSFVSDFNQAAPVSAVQVREGAKESQKTRIAPSCENPLTKFPQINMATSNLLPRASDAAGANVLTDESGGRARGRAEGGSRGQSRGGSRGRGNGNYLDEDHVLPFPMPQDRFPGSDSGVGDYPPSRDGLKSRQTVSEINEIWVPPPSFGKKKLPSTIVIFPLHTVDASTSTADMISEDLPLEKITPLKDAAPQKETNRAGRPSELEKFQSELTVSTNPLALLYQKFFPYLSVLSRHHLMAAASGSISDRSAPLDYTSALTETTQTTASLAALFEMVAEEVSKLEHTSFSALEAIVHSERHVHDLILTAEAGKPIDEEFLTNLREVCRYALRLVTICVPIYFIGKLGSLRLQRPG
jgi:hypothetical protein